ncbi:enkurin isoform X1 [Brachyistius frenatus]|uniref:enkurin isoform X1 n=2 Tax=Brachyistius frenatus TaxID=100188 RepID=UPI0037E7DE98
MPKAFHPRESVYNLIPKEESECEQPPRYVSRFHSAAVLESKVNKDARRGMGPAKVEVPSPDKYLKKHSKEPKLPEQSMRAEDFQKTCTCRGSKPPVPRRSDNPPMGLQTTRDFTKTNIPGPMKPRPACVDSSNGHKQPLENSGLVPKYIMKKDYGEVPAYLQQRSEEERRALEEYDDFLKEQREQVAMKQMSDEERQAILGKLKEKWDRLHQEYQGLSLFIDTLSKKARKQRLEESMKQLEKDITFFERFKTLYKPNV